MRVVDMNNFSLPKESQHFLLLTGLRHAAVLQGRYTIVVQPLDLPVNDPTAGIQHDSVLESCEEPVALAEPAGAPLADVPRSKSPSDAPIPPEPDSSDDSSFTPGPPSDDLGSALPGPNELPQPHQPQPQITPP